ncbi:MAG: DUF177 domain-containing protein [Candidatus Eremiobacteraeota bacterium]|nr:DUF177 domain-containing protein [Candidatus Eremiobacteraeota bacterium]
MDIEVKEILKLIGSKKKVTGKEPLALNGEGIKETVDVAYDLEVNNAGSRLIVKGTLDTVVRLQCSRCLESFPEKFHVMIQEEFLPEDSPELKRKSDLNLSDLNVFVYKGEKLDAGEIMRQNILAAFPMCPVCSSECKGLCPVCGENLNSRACGCPTERRDPRLESLERLLGKPPLGEGKDGRG